MYTSLALNIWRLSKVATITPKKKILHREQREEREKERERERERGREREVERER